jgi:hypothetical protein
MEGYLFAINKTSVTLSVQELTSCSSAYGNAGCNGGDSLGSSLYILIYIKLYNIDIDIYIFKISIYVCE